jgi:tRNA U34 2-thiouridine synthase MnmA/TrmU
MSASQPHAIALFSGGLDSCLAVLLMLKQEVKVTALTFLMHFGCDPGDKSSCSHDPYPVAEKFGFEVKMMHLGQKFIEIVRDPKHGRGKNMNPCVDCRILMLAQAKEYMEIVNADFVISGEVLGQRPFSQMRDKMNLTVRESGLKGRLLRPLSAKLLEPTIPELQGLVDREQLEDISGRSRKRQMELAREFGLTDYPSPAGGCLLTNPDYARKLKDLLDHDPLASYTDINLLRAGRHFRFSPQTKIIVGRNEEDNKKIETIAGPGDVFCEVMNTGSPLTLIRGADCEDARRTACGLTARFSRRRGDREVKVTWTRAGTSGTITVQPATEDMLARLRI